MNYVQFSYEHGDLQAYPDLSALISQLEKIDVVNDEYQFWDENLNEYSLDTALWPRIWNKPLLNILISPKHPLGKDRIFEIMQEYCRKFGIEEGDGRPSTLARAILAFQLE